MPRYSGLLPESSVIPVDSELFPGSAALGNRLKAPSISGQPALGSAAGHLLAAERFEVAAFDFEAENCPNRCLWS